MKKIVFGGIGLGLFAIVAFLGYHFVKGVLRGMQVPADLAAKTWVEHKLIPDMLLIDVPSPIKLKASTTNVASTGPNFFTYQGEGLFVLCAAKQVGTSTSENLDALADRMVEITRDQSGAVISSPTKTETTVMGTRAIELQMEMKEKWKLPSQFRGLYFYYNGHLIQINCNSGLNQPVATVVWERMKKSIRPPQGIKAGPKTGITPGAPSLPPGVRRRTE